MSPIILLHVPISCAVVVEKPMCYVWDLCMAGIDRN